MSIWLFLGFNPCWKETAEFRLTVPELDILVIAVMDKDTMTENDLVGVGVFPVKSLKSGILIRLYYIKLLISIYVIV